MEIVKCLVCNKEQKVTPTRKKLYKTCSHKCASILKKSKIVLDGKCVQCNKEFVIGKNKNRRLNSKFGLFCSIKCSSEYKKNHYLGINNPNFRGKQYDSNGYRIHHYPKIGRMKESHYITFNTLDINKLPKGYNIHHRDCNIYNNIPNNLVILSAKDHRWLHKQFGNATLWAFMNNKITFEELCTWSNDKDKNYLLQLNILQQIGVFKSDKLLENL